MTLSKLALAALLALSTTMVMAEKEKEEVTEKKEEVTEKTEKTEKKVDDKAADDHSEEKKAKD